MLSLPIWAIIGARWHDRTGSTILCGVAGQLAWLAVVLISTSDNRYWLAGPETSIFAPLGLAMLISVAAELLLAAIA